MMTFTSRKRTDNRAEAADAKCPADALMFRPTIGLAVTLMLVAVVSLLAAVSVYALGRCYPSRTGRTGPSITLSNA
jgi:hypothetical protein